MSMIQRIQRLNDGDLSVSRGANGFRGDASVNCSINAACEATVLVCLWDMKHLVI